LGQKRGGEGRGGRFNGESASSLSPADRLSHKERERGEGNTRITLSRRVGTNDWSGIMKGLREGRGGIGD